MGIIASTYSHMVQAKKNSPRYVYLYLLRENDTAKKVKHLGSQDDGYRAVQETLCKSKII